MDILLQAKKKSILLGKVYNEYLERFKMVNNDRIEGEVDLVSLNDLSVEKEDRKTLTYEIDDVYGVKDTTGTSSGLNSSFLIEKAVLELIEKNELIPIWYKKRCQRVEIKNKVKDLLIEYGLNLEEIKILYGQNISNVHTVVSIIFDKNNKIVGSGSASDRNAINSLKSSVEEAIMQRLVNKNCTLFSDLNETDKFYVYFKNLYKNIEAVDLENLKSEKDININENFNDIQIGLLNISGMQREITIKALSKKMMNCVPALSNIKGNENKYIIKYFDIGNDVDTLIECPIL